MLLMDARARLQASAYCYRLASGAAKNTCKGRMTTQALPPCSSTQAQNAMNRMMIQTGETTTLQALDEDPSNDARSPAPNRLAPSSISSGVLYEKEHRRKTFSGLLSISGAALNIVEGTVMTFAAMQASNACSRTPSGPSSDSKGCFSACESGAQGQHASHAAVFGQITYLDPHKGEHTARRPDPVIKQGGQIGIRRITWE